MSDLLVTYPELATAIGRLCGGQTWCFTGTSVLLLDATHLYLEITKPEHWRRINGTLMADHAAGLAQAKGHRLLAGIGAIGGSLEGDEGVLACLWREVEEEIGAPVVLHSADETHLVYEERAVETLALLPEGGGTRPDAPSGAGLPAPVLCTVSRNLYRRRALPDARVLAIATFWATLAGPPRLGDLFGLLAVPIECLGKVLAEPQPRRGVRPDAPTLYPTVKEVRGLPGVRLETRQPMEEDTLLAPVWTARSLQILIQGGRLRFPSRWPSL